MTLASFPVVLGIAAFAVQATPAQISGERHSLTSDDLQVLAAVLPTALKGHRTVVVDSTQLLELRILADLEGLSGLLPDTKEDLLLQNRLRVRLMARRARLYGLDVVTQRTADTLVGSGKLNTWVSVSRVGFSHDHQQAVVHAVMACGFECGGAEFFLLERREGKCRVRASFPTLRSSDLRCLTSA